MSTFMNLFEELNKLYEDEEKKALTEALHEDDDSEIVVDEEEVEETEVAEEAEDVEEPVEEEPRQLVLECASCGALSVCDEADAQIDEETDLVNVEAACEQCEKAEGYKILGVLAPYADEPIEEAVEKEILTEGKFIDALKKAATRIGADAAAIVRCFGELSGSEAAYDLTSYIENKAVLKALQSGNKTVFNTMTQDDIEELAQDIAAYERDSAHRKATKDTDFLVLVRRNVWDDGKETYDAEAYATSEAALEKYRKEHLRYESDEDIQIVSAKEAKKLTGEDITRSADKFIDEIEEGLFDFGKKKREAERKRQEEEEAARRAEQEKSKKSKWPTAADYAAYEREQQEKRRIDAQMAQYKAMGQGWNKRDDSSSPSNTPYTGVNYSGGDYF